MLRGLSCAVTAYFMYTVLNLVAVAVAMDRMQDHRAALQRNVERLKEINQRLREEFDALSTSPDLIRLYAREIGLYAPGERVIRLQGVGDRPPFYDVGTAEPRLDTPPAPRFAFMLAGIAAGGLLYVRLRFRDRSRDGEGSADHRSVDERAGGERPGDARSRGERTNRGERPRRDRVAPESPEARADLLRNVTPRRVGDPAR